MRFLVQELSWESELGSSWDGCGGSVNVTWGSALMNEAYQSTRMRIVG